MKIALTGKMRSGKDTVAAHLCERYGFERVAFGDALKRNAHAVFPWISAESKPRSLYQQFGQVMRQEFDENVWIKHARLAVDSIVGAVVITDLRQPNEYEWARTNGFVIIRVTAPDGLRIKRAISAGDDFTVHDLAHETELAIDGFAVDAEIVNDGSVDDLKRKIDEIMEAIG